MLDYYIGSLEWSRRHTIESDLEPVMGGIAPEEEPIANQLPEALEHGEYGFLGGQHLGEVVGDYPDEPPFVGVGSLGMVGYAMEAQEVFHEKAQSSLRPKVSSWTAARRDCTPAVMVPVQMCEIVRPV